jgi:hypothetical protein
VDGQAPGRTEGTKGVTKIDGPIDVEDTEFRGMVWDKWKAFREGAEGSGGECAVCKEVIEDVDVSRTLCLLGVTRSVRKEFSKIDVLVLFSRIT